MFPRGKRAQGGAERITPHELGIAPQKRAAK
jgi:hypothetical protein